MTNVETETINIAPVLSSTDLLHAQPFIMPEVMADLRPMSVDTMSIIGLGYVGAVSVACLAKSGFDVIGVDLDELKVQQIASGFSPIAEPGLADALSSGVENLQITATQNLHQAILDSQMTFISVSTPTAPDGSCDHTAIEAVAKSIGLALKEKDTYHNLVLRCSVPPGTTEKIFIPIVEKYANKTAGIDFGVCFNPEFLRESTAIEDFENPPKTVIGCLDPQSGYNLAQILSPIDDKPFYCDLKTAEMVKYVDNVWHATKVCFGNEVGRMCKDYHIDGHRVMDLFCQDTVLNISGHYLKPGFAFGGSCLPKEVRAVQYLGQKQGTDLPLFNSLINSNVAQIGSALQLITDTAPQTVGIVGLSFKPDTDDVRESPVLELISHLLDQDIQVKIYDPNYQRDNQLKHAIRQLQHHYPRDAHALTQLIGHQCNSISELSAASDTVLITHNTPALREILPHRLQDVHVIDVARVFETTPNCLSYQGIGW